MQQQGEELSRARDIQMDLLPKELPEVPGIEVSGAWLPARTVGGDYFDVLRLDDSRLGICIGDVSGKGITAALLMANLQAAFRAYATPKATLAEVCTRLNEFVCGNVAPGKFITFFYAILDARERKVISENAGRCAGLLIKSNGQVEQMQGQGVVLASSRRGPMRISRCRSPPEIACSSLPTASPKPLNKKKWNSATKGSPTPRVPPPARQPS